MNGQLPADLLGLLKSGSITICENNKKAVEIRAAKKDINVNIVSLPQAISAKRVITSISEARSLARSLRERGITLTVSNNDKTIVRIGKGAKPKLSRLVTLSGDVEVTDLRELRRLDRRLRTT